MLLGLGSGISLFIATNVSENILWRSFSPITIKTESGTEFEGALINFVHLMITKSNKSITVHYLLVLVNALYSAFMRESAPNMNNLFATFFVIMLVIYL